MSHSHNRITIPKITLGLFLTAIAARAQTIPEPAVGSIQGIVINESGERVAGATVWGYSADNFKRQFRVESGAQGDFVLEGIPAGLFYISAFKESEFYPYKFFAFFNNTETGHDLFQVGVEAGRRTENVAIQIGPKAASITFHITRLDGTPLKEGATIRFVRNDIQGGAPLLRGATSPDYTMLVPAVPFHFTVEAPGYITSGSQLITPHSGQGTTVTVRLFPLSPANKP